MKKRIICAALALCLLMGLVPGVLAQTDEEIVAMFEEYADAMREAILNSPTGIYKSDEYIPGETYTGTAYYISDSDGDDENDGLSPEHPWKTLNMAWATELQPGDAVFLKRGDMFRSFLLTKNGVTYSAYGEGPKPVITSSPEDGADPEKWELYYEDETGKKVWKFYRDLPQSGGIYLNNGETLVRRAYGWWTGDHYIDVKITFAPQQHPNAEVGWNLVAGGEQIPESSLEDMEFCWMAPLDGLEFPINSVGGDGPGPLYFRCDAGNPGELFDNIEFCAQEWCVICMPGYCEGVVLDNLAALYWSNAAIGADEQTGLDMVLQNCEVGYGCNNINSYMQPEPTQDYMMISDSIYGLVRNTIIRNNYVHDADGAGITFESHGDDGVAKLLDANGNENTKHTYLCERNLIERCGAGIQINDGNDWYNFSRVTIQDNCIMDTGKRQGAGCFSGIGALSIGAWGRLNIDLLEVSRNALCRSNGFILNFGVDTIENTEPDFHDNSYIQDANGWFGLNQWGQYIPTQATYLIDVLKKYLHNDTDWIVLLWN